MRVRALVWLAAIFCSMPAAIADSPQMSKGVDLFNKRNYREAVVIFDGIARGKTGDAANAAYYAGLCYQGTGDRFRAEQMFNYVIQTVPGSVASNNARTALRNMLQDRQQTQTPTRSSSTSYSSGAASSPGIQRAQSYDGPATDLAFIPKESKFYFREQQSGHMLVDASINGRPLTCMFDTGATGLTIGSNHLRQLGIPLPTTKPDDAVRGGWSGVSLPAWSVELNVKVGSLERKLVAKVQEAPLDMEPLIGYAFIKGLKYEIDRPGKCVYVHNGSAGGDSDVRHEMFDVPCKIVNTKAYCPIEINGKKTAVFIDTGADSTIFSASTMSQLGIEIPADAPTSYGSGIGGVSVYKEMEVDLRMGPIIKKGFKISVGGASTNCAGQDFLEGWRFTIDQEKGLMRFRH